MNDDVTQNWLKFLNPNELKQNLIRCSIFITAWELLKEAIVDRIQWFYTHISGKKHTRPRYHKEVMELDKRKKKDPILASCLWLRNNKSIDDSDIQIISEIRKHRNFLAHEMTNILGSTRLKVNLDLLVNLVDILSKIEKWWITQVELPTNPDFTAEDLDNIDYDRILSMRMMVLQLLTSVAYGDDKALTELYEAFKKNAESDSVNRAH